MAEAYPTPTIIYGLWSTRDRVIRYIGQTTGGIPDARLSKHRYAARCGRSGAVPEWIRGEVAEGFDVHLRVLFWHGDAAVSEREYIALYRAMGAPLLNASRGADLSALPEERAHPLSVETRRKISAANRGRPKSEATKIKLMRAHYEMALTTAREADSRLSAYLHGPLA